MQCSGVSMVAVGGKLRSQSSKRSTIASRTSSDGMCAKSDTTSNDAMHSSGAMLACLMLSRNCWELEMLCSDPALSSVSWSKIHFDSLHEGESTNDTIILRGLLGLWILGGPQAQEEGDIVGVSRVNFKPHERTEVSVGLSFGGFLGNWQKMVELSTRPQVAYCNVAVSSCKEDWRLHLALSTSSA